MNRATTLAFALAAALPAVVLTAAAGQASAAAPLGSAPRPDVPADFVTLVDDTGTITVGVPSSWSEVDTAPSETDPWISATPDFAALVSSFSVPGMMYQALQPTEDLEILARDTGYAASCATEAIELYADTVFQGVHLTNTGCGRSGTAQYHVIAANPPDKAFTALLEVQLTGPEQLPILDGILQTFDVAPGAAASPASGWAPSGNVPSTWSTIVDATNTIELAVPETWVDIDVAPYLTEDGRQQPAISATTDESLFFPPEGTADTFSVPGVQYQALPYTTDTTTRLAMSSFHDVCDAQPAHVYDDGVFAGHIQMFEACGGTATRNVMVVANPSDQAFTAVLLAQLVGQPEDEATLDGLLSSFYRASSSPAPATTVAGGQDPNLDSLLDQLGLTLDPDQLDCIAGQQVSASELEVAAANPSNMPANVLVSLLNCGVDVFDIPSG